MSMCNSINFSFSHFHQSVNPPVMGRVAVRLMKCKICKTSYPSFSKELRSKLTQRTHRFKNKKCVEVQARLRKLHEEAGNIGDLVFLDDDEVVEAATDGSNV